MISVFDRDAHILIDPGVTHSFISMGFISVFELVRHVPLFCDHEVHKSKRFVVGLRK